MNSTPGFHQTTWITSVCRLCFTERKQAELIFDGDSRYLSEWIEKLTSLKITNVPQAPASLCSDCKSTLEAFDAFREMCITNDHVFKETFCRDNFQPKQLADVAVKVEYDEDQQMEMDVKPSIKSEINACSEQFDVASTELLLDVYEAKVQDIRTSTESENGAENTIAEDVIKIECHGIDHNSKIDAGDQMMEEDQIEENVQEHHSAEVVLSKNLKYMCKICSKSVTKLHMLTHKESELFQCYFCWKSFRRLHIVSLHIFKWHKKEYNNLKIEIVDSNAENNCANNTSPTTATTGCDNSLRSAIMGSDGQYDLSSYKDGYFECKVCNRNESEMHIKTHKEKGIFQCYICAKKFNRSSKCLDHINNHWRPDMPTSTCNYCKICLKFASKSHVVSHKAVGLYVCKLCESQFKNSWSLNMHMRHVHEGKNASKIIDAEEDLVPANSKTPINNIDVSLDSLVEDGDAILISVEDKVYNQKDLMTCKICDKMVSKLHMKTHKANALFVCYICSKMFKKFDYLSKHMNHHIKEKKKITRDVQISDCNKSQQNEIDDNNQTQDDNASTSETSDVIQQPKEILLSSTASDLAVCPKGIDESNRSYECKVCATFVTKLHAESHTPEGFQCSICMSQYTKFDCYSRHIRIHRDKGKYVCKICNKELSNAYAMSRHVQLHESYTPRT